MTNPDNGEPDTWNTPNRKQTSPGVTSPDNESPDMWYTPDRKQVFIAYVLDHVFSQYGGQVRVVYVRLG